MLRLFEFGLHVRNLNTTTLLLFPDFCLSGVHEGNGGLLPPAGQLHPLS